MKRKMQNKVLLFAMNELKHRGWRWQQLMGGRSEGAGFFRDKEGTVIWKWWWAAETTPTPTSSGRWEVRKRNNHQVRGYREVSGLRGESVFGDSNFPKELENTVNSTYGRLMSFQRQSGRVWGVRKDGILGQTGGCTDRYGNENPGDKQTSSESLESLMVTWINTNKLWCNVSCDRLEQWLPIIFDKLTIRNTSYNKYKNMR